VLEVLSQPVPHAQRELVCGASIGASRFPRDGQTDIELIAAADQAMYRAKSEGRMRICLAAPGPAESALPPWQPR
jgi:GGDEF domain-containing protein